MHIAYFTERPYPYVPSDGSLLDTFKVLVFEDCLDFVCFGQGFYPKFESCQPTLPASGHCHQLTLCSTSTCDATGFNTGCLANRKHTPPRKLNPARIKKAGV